MRLEDLSKVQIDPTVLAVLNVVGVIFVLCIFVLIAIPYTGILVRLRANHTPFGIRTGVEDDNAAVHDPAVTSFFGMLKRVKRIEGWAGLYKGLMPTVVFSFLLQVFAGSYQMAHVTSTSHATIGGIFLRMFCLPATIITNRAIVTPYKLRSFRPIESLQKLLTEKERKKPWVLYQTPGLVIAGMINVGYMTRVAMPIRGFLLNQAREQDELRFLAVILVLYFGNEILTTAVMCPLQVILIRLSIQRNHASVSPEVSAETQEVPAGSDVELNDEKAAVPVVAVNNEQDVEYAGAEEDVVRLRDENDPYLNIVDCGRRIVAEEGWGALYRTWGIMVIMAILVAAPGVLPYAVNLAH